MTQYGLRPYDAGILTASRPLADYFEEAAAGADAKAIANYVTGDLARLLNASGQEIGDCRVTAPNLRELIALRDGGKITNNTAKAVLDENVRNRPDRRRLSWTPRASPPSPTTAPSSPRWTARLPLTPTSSPSSRAGNEKSKNALTGQVMKAMKGQARPDVVNRLIDARLAAL